MFKIMITSLLTLTNAQYIIPGSQVDVSGHGCVIDGGYEWCEELQTCIRPWETECTSLRDCSEPCPPPFSCPMPALFGNDMSRCKLNDNLDNCGCQISCPSYDCSSLSCQTDNDCHSNQFCRQILNDVPMLGGRRGLQNSECVDKVGINSTCGGYVIPGTENRCMDGLECVQTMGPMVEDAPGQCREPCSENERRDNHGDCINSESIVIPDNCATWMDGCNTCQVRNGVAQICTMMYCFRQGTPHCISYHIQKNSLTTGDVCYRFCEDGTQSTINRRSDCPSGTTCVDPLRNTDIMSFDTCNERAWTCQVSNH